MAEMLTTAAVADALGIQRRTVNQLRFRGSLPEPDARDENGRLLWKRATIRTWARTTGRPFAGDAPDLIGRAAAARILGIYPDAVTALVREGVLRPAAKAPGRKGAYWFRRDDIESDRVRRAVIDRGRVSA
jgi:hypothetical protein